MNRSTLRILGVSILATMPMPMTAIGADDKGVDQPEIRRDGVGSLRDRLNASELKPFDAGLFSKLSSWKNGEAPTAETIKGKVVAVVTWAKWREPSVRVMNQLADMQAKSPKDLLVVAVHASSQWDDAVKMMEEQGVKALCGHDAKGEFRKALMSEQNPDVFLIDRAGQMRFADVEIASVEKAVQTLIGETAEQAAGRNAIIADAARKAKEAAAKTGKASAGPEAGERLRKVPFKAPDASAYDAVLWPPKIKSDSLQQFADDLQGKSWPIEFATLENAWLPVPGRDADAQAPDLDGRVTVVWVWNLQAGSNFTARETVEFVARHNRRDVNVVAYNLGDKKLDLERWLRVNKTDMYYLYDTEKKTGEKLRVTAFPMIYVISSDGLVRWQGHPKFSEFQRVVEDVINRDPGVAARRVAEDAVMRQQGGK